MDVVNKKIDKWIRPWEIEKFDDLKIRDERFFSIVIKGVLGWLTRHIVMYNKPIKHFIFNTGSSYMYVEANGYTNTWKETSGEDYMYMETPRCLATIGDISIPQEELTNPFVRGVYERYSDDGQIKGYNAEMRRLPIEINISLQYVLSNFNETIILIQELFDKLVFQRYFKITYQDDTPVIDPFYYDETTDALWIGHYATTNNTLKFLKIENPSTKFSSIQNYPTFATSTGFSVSGATYTAFAIQGSDIYIAYTNSGTSYLQRGTITGSNDSGFSITAKGTAQSTEQMGVAGTINDIAILYDGYVYVLVSDREKLNGSAINDGDTVKSRGAILKISGTDSGFEVEDILGWTNSARAIKSKKLNDENNPYNGVSEQIDSINAYIPALSESSKKFYGAERFVAIKPKELAIADCGANIILPDYKNKKNGNMFQHDRVVTVNLYDFAISNVTELNNLDFKSLSISGVISYITDFTSSYSSDEE